MNKIFKELKPYLIIVVVVVLIRSFIATPVIVQGDSMVPTLEDKQLLLLNKLSYKFNDIKRYDIVVIKVDNNKEIIKRVIGLPGEIIEYRDNKLYINGKEEKSKYNYETEDFNMEEICNCEKIPENKYLVLGDNRTVSADSRIIGLIDKKDIIGKTTFSFWPIKTIK